MKIIPSPKLLAVLALTMLPVAFAAEKIVNTATIIDGTTKDRAVISQEMGYLSESGSNLQLKKTVERATVAVGEAARFEITLTNPRDTAATGLELIDLFDEEFFLLEPGSLSPAECYGDASRIRCLFPNLAPNQQKTISYRLTARQAGASANVVTVTEPGQEELSDNALVVITDPGAPFQMSKAPDKAAIAVGEEVAYTVTVTNKSDNQTLQNLSIVDDFPEALLTPTGVTGAAGMTCQQDASRVTCTLAQLLPSQSLSFVARFRAQKAGTATNLVNAEDSIKRKAGAGADVIIADGGSPFLITKSPDKPVIKVGEEVRFSVSVRNRTASQTLNNVVITDDFPEASLQILELSPQAGFACQQDASRIRCNLATMGPGETRAFSARYLALKEGAATNTVTAAHQGGGEATESASVTVQDNSDPFLVTKTPDRGTLNIGETVTFTVTLASRIPTAGTQAVTLTDDYAESKLEFLRAEVGTGVTCQNSNGIVTCSIPTFSSANTYSMRLSYRAIDDGAINNRVTARNGSGHLSSVTADVIVLATDSPFIVSKQPDKPTIDVGEDVNYTVNITARPDMGNRSFVTLVDDYPEEFLRIRTINTSAGLSCVHDAAEIRCSIQNPVAGRTYTLTSRFTSLKPGTAVNTVSLTGDENAVLGETKAEVIILDPGNPFVITKRPNKEVLEIGENVEFTVTVTNRTQKQTLRNVTFADDFPEASLEILDLMTVAGFPCQSDSSKITCTLENFAPGQTVTYTARYKTKTAGQITNKVKVSEEKGPSKEAEATVTVLEPGAAFYLTKTANKSKIEVGEKVSYTVGITNRLKALTLQEVKILDDYPEDTLQFEGLKTSSGLLCERDAAEIRCRVPAFAPGLTHLLTVEYKALKAGTVTNTVRATAENGKEGTVSAKLEITEPVLREIRLTSDCEGRTVIVGQQCLLSVIAYYLYQDEKNVSGEAKYYNFENIGTLAGNLLTTTKEGTAALTASFGGKTSNVVTIRVVKELAAGTTTDGKIIGHFPARTGGGLPDTAIYGEAVQIGSEPATPAAVGRHDRLTFKAVGGAAGFTWSLADQSFGTLSDFFTGTLCPKDGNGYRCVNTGTVSFAAAKREGTVALTLSDNEGSTRSFTIHVLKPATESLEILDPEGRPINAALTVPQEKNIKLGCRETLANGTVLAENAGQVAWEFRYNGGSWTVASDAGTIGGGVLTPLKSGSYAVRAKRVQKAATAGVTSLMQVNDEVLSPEVTIEVGEPVPYIDSIRLDGNLGIAEGTTPTLFLRLRHFGTVADIGDIEIDLLKGRFTDPTKVPADTQHFKIELVANQLLAQNAGKNTVLLEVPVLIPILDDLKDGPHTIRVIVNNQSGLTGKSIAVGVLPVFVGMPQKGDADLSGTIDLVDAVLTSRFLAGVTVPDSLQLFAVDTDRSGLISLRDFVEIFQALLTRFLK